MTPSILLLYRPKWTGEYIFLENNDVASNSGGESECLPPSENEEKPEEPSDQEESSDSFSLDKAFGFVDFDEVSV